MSIFRCPVCGYLHTKSIDFHFCPVCNTPSKAFLHEPTDKSGCGDINIQTMIRSMAKQAASYTEGKGTTRTFLNMDNLIFLPAMIARLPLTEEEEVDTGIILGKKSQHPIQLQTPILNAAMSYGALSKEAKMALASASSLAGTIANSGEGGMLAEERDLADHITLQYSTGRFGISNKQLQQADMIEIKLSQGTKPGMGGRLPGPKVSPEIAAVRGIATGKTAHSPAIHPDIHTPEQLSQKIADLRTITQGKPVALKLVGGHIENDLTAVFSQQHIPDVLVIDGGEGGTGAAPVIMKDHVGLPLIYSLPRVANFLEEQKLTDRVTLIAAGGMRHSGDVAKALALGAEGVYMGGALKIALGCTYLRQCHLGSCPYGIATQDKKLRKRLDVKKGAVQVANFIRTATAEVQAIARSCGKPTLRDLNRDDLAALDTELAQVTGVAQAFHLHP